MNESHHARSSVHLMNIMHLPFAIVVLKKNRCFQNEENSIREIQVWIMEKELLAQAHTNTYSIGVMYNGPLSSSADTHAKQSI